MYILLKEIEGQNSEGDLIKFKVGTKLMKLDSEDIMIMFERTDIRRFEVLNGEHEGKHIITYLEDVEAIKDEI